MPEDENKTLNEDNQSVRDALAEFLAENKELFSVENRIRSDVANNAFNSIQSFIKQYDELQQLGRFWELDDENSEISRSLTDVYKKMAALDAQEEKNVANLEAASGPTVEDFTPEEVKLDEDEPEFTSSIYKDPNHYDMSAMQEPFRNSVEFTLDYINSAPVSDDPTVQLPLNRMKLAGEKLLSFMDKKGDMQELSRQEAAPFYTNLQEYIENANKLQLRKEHVDSNLLDEAVLSGKAGDYMRKSFEQRIGINEDNRVDSLLGLPERSKYEPHFPETDHYGAMLKMIDDVDPAYIRSSADFRSAKKDITDILKTLKDPKSNVSEAQMNEKICKAYDHTLLYLETKTKSIEMDRKKGKEPSELALKRVAAMEKISLALKTKLEESYQRNPNLKEPTNKDMVSMLRSASSKKPANKEQQEFMNAGSKYANMLEKDNVNLYEHFNKERANVLMNALVSEERFLSSSKNIEAAPKEKAKTVQTPQMRM